LSATFSLTSRRRAGNETIRQIEQAGGKATFIRADISEPQDIEAAFRQIKQLYGRLDCACNMPASTAIGLIP